MSSRHTSIKSVDEKWLLVDEHSKNGSFVNGKKVSTAPLCDGDIVEVGSTFFVFREQRSNDSVYESLLVAGAPSTHCDELRELYRELKSVAPYNLPVLVLGETGTGKELVAQLIHRWSGRTGPFCAVNCATIPATLAESTLFGHKKGAFSDAREDSPGLIRSAHNGTLFLDELVELDLPLQAKLLRAIQEREVTPVGSSTAVPVDFRLVAATHADLDHYADSGRFRPDLLARIDGHRATVPPLRKRIEDLGLLIRELWSAGQAAASEPIEIERDAARALYAYKWPRNVRELRQAIERCRALGSNGRLTLNDLPARLRMSFDAPVAAGEPSSGAAHRQALVDSLTKHGGNVTAVAKEFGVARVQVRRWCARYELNVQGFRRRLE
jgi:transcriptional regulator with PAS, ATPase and Fis domain